MPFKVQFTKDEIAEYLQKVEEIVTSGYLIPGKYNTELETLFAKLVGSKYAVTLITGTTALEVIYRSLDVAGKEVLVPANTNYATAEAVIRAGGKVVLYDSDLFPDFEDLQKRVTKQTRAIVVVHIGGYITPEIKKIATFCKKNNIFLVEDASHAHGATYKNRHAGTFGVAGAISLFATKIVTSSEGGVLVTNKKTMKQLGTIFRDQGKARDGIHNIIFGSAWRMSELHAALGIVEMKTIHHILKRNNEIVLYYKNNINSDKITIPYDKDTYYSGYKHIILLKTHKQRQALTKFLFEHGIKAGKNVYDIPLHLQPALPFDKKHRFPRAEKFAKTHLCLPIWKGMTDEEVKKVVDVVTTWTKQ